ncbi:MAG: hypothetical protein Ta2A_16700 [Treponemataceae bacterium]|nr:MAG: hypothetical protein Ta2A_16700 [Treponemataceae bacterium]
MKRIFLSVVLLAASVSVFAQMSDEDFFRLCSRGSLDDVRAAVAGNANVNAWGEVPDPDGFKSFYTCLMIACKNERPDIAEFLLERGAKPNTHSREYPIHFVMGWRDVPKAQNFLRKLVAKDAEVDARTVDGLTPLMMASDMTGITTPDEMEAKQKLAILLVELGASVDARDVSGNTPLLIALSSGVKNQIMHGFLIKLVDSGANTKAKNSIGENAVTILKRYDSRKAGEIKYYSWYWKIMDDSYPD